jgi:uncharacterized protein (DUF1697 family)
MPTGKNKVPMADLRKALEAEGFGDVRTYIQSGNAVVRSTKSAREVESSVREAIAKRIGPELEIVVRSPKELQEILDRNPFPTDARDRVYFTMFLQAPDPRLLAEFLKTDFGADKIRHVEGCLYTLYATKWSDSKFNNNVYEKKLKVSATTRNTNTIEAMIELGKGC